MQIIPSLDKKMKYFLITFVTVVSSFQQFYQQIHDQMPFFLSLKWAQNTNGDSKSGNFIQQFMMAPNINDNTLSKRSSETQLRVTNAMKHVSFHSKTALTTRTNSPESQIEQQNNAQRISQHHPRLGKFRSFIFVRF